MNLIDRSLSGESASLYPALLPKSPDNRQGWLKALEEAGLRDALQNTRAFVSDRDSVSPEQAHQEKALPISAPAPLALDETNNLRRFDPPHMEQLHDFSHSQQRTNARLPRGEIATPASACAEYMKPVVEPMAINHVERDCTSCPAVEEPQNQERKTWAMRNLILLPTEYGGVEIWVRDAKLSAARMQMLLSDIRRTLTDLDSGPVSVFLNGQPVTPAYRNSHKGE